MVRHTLKILQHLLQDFWSVSDHFGTFCIKGLRTPIRDLHYIFQENYKAAREHFPSSFFCYAEAGYERVRTTHFFDNHSVLSALIAW